MTFPFAALVGQPDLRLALLLGSVDWRLSLLLKGDKGSGKSTAARALADILPAGAAFINVPIGTTEDRLLGGLDLGQALQGKAELKRGLIHQAHGGVLYIDEINLIADSLTDALLDVASSGRHYVERDGFSSSSDSSFILLGSMNREEGELRPQLLDRFALSLHVQAPMDIEERASIIESRLRFDADPEAVCASFEHEQQLLRQAILDARLLIPTIKPSGEILRQISEKVTRAGVRSLRADLAALRAAIAHAALSRRADVNAEDIDAILPLVLHHRAKASPNQTPKPPAESSPPSNDRGNESGQERPEGQDRVFPIELANAPELRVNLADSIARGRTAKAKQHDAGPCTTSGAVAGGAELDVIASFKQSFRNTGRASLKSEHLIFRTHVARSGVRFLFLVDASGSHTAQQRMSAVKGLVAALLNSSVDAKDEVAVISFRGSKAEIVLKPCRDAEAALRVLEFLPTGGRTPLAHALELGGSLVNTNSLLILVTDGRANVPLNGTDPWQDALDAAAKLNCASVLVNTSQEVSSPAAMETLASAMKAKLLSLDDLSKESLLALAGDLT